MIQRDIGCTDNCCGAGIVPAVAVSPVSFAARTAVPPTATPTAPIKAAPGDSLIVPVIQQAPVVPISAAGIPDSATSDAGESVGFSATPSVPVDNSFTAPIAGEDPVSGKPVIDVPVSAALTQDQVETTSQQSGENPGPVPAVGTQSPAARSALAVPGRTPAPKAGKQWPAIAIVIAIIIGLWFFAGWSFREAS